MAREIEFRGWDMPGKRWMNEHSVYALLKERQMTGHDYGRRYSIEQFTGLRDKNGKKIFKGDILETDVDGVGRKLRSVVAWSDELPGFYHRLPVRQWSHLIVIGNIHENGDLLED